jgi:hypothetical protein
MAEMLYLVMMRFLHSKLRARSSWIALIGITCVALVLMIGIVQVVHSHPSGHPDPDCSLCVTAHQAVQVVALITLDVSSQPVEHVSPEPQFELPRRSFFFRLDCRPPPAESTIA